MRSFHADPSYTAYAERFATVHRLDHNICGRWVEGSVVYFREAHAQRAIAELVEEIVPWDVAGEMTEQDWEELYAEYRVVEVDRLEAEAAGKFARRLA